MTRSRSSPQPPGNRSRALRLEQVLRLLPARELTAIVEGLRINIDRGKRIDPPAQVARALVCLPEARDPSCLPETARQLLYRIIEAKGVLPVNALPAAVEPLVARGLVFARASEGGGAELLLPIAYMVQLKTWEGENPRGIRALLTQVSPSVAAGIASHYLGSSATNPISLSLEAAWSALTDSSHLERELDALASAERRLLVAIEELGGEVDTEELLELEREPLRLRGASGATPSRRGVGFALERRGFLIPIHPNRHVIPSEVAALVGAGRRAARDERRRQIRAVVEGEDHSPRRASFARDVAPLALAMAASVREKNLDVRPDLGTPRSLVTRFATRFGQDQAVVALVAALSRAVGLWDASARNASAPPGSWSMNELGRQLFEVWHQGGAWDEARPDGEVLRAAGASREPSVIGVVRSIVLDSLVDLGEGRWIPWEAISGFLLTDSRAPGLTRLLERWAQRCGFDPKGSTLESVAERIAFESLHILGVVDVGEPEAGESELAVRSVSGERARVDGNDPEAEPAEAWDAGAASSASSAAVVSGLGRARVPRILRITPRGRAYLSGLTPAVRRESSFRDSQVLRLGEEVTVAGVLALVPFVEIGRVDEQLDVVISTTSVSNALASGVDAAVIRQRLESVAALPEPVARALVQASAVLGRAQYVSTPGFLWVDDPELRELLRTRRQTADLFIEPSPPGGLLLAPGVDLERVMLRCRTLGVEVVADAEARAAVASKPGTPLPSDPESRTRSAATRRPSGTRRRETGGRDAGGREAGTTVPGSRRSRVASTG
jgi:hypothetical protein